IFARIWRVHLACDCCPLRPRRSARGDVVWLDTMVSAVGRIALPLAAGLLLNMSFGAASAVAAPVPLTSLMGSPAEGTWRTQDGTEITIAPCDQGLCGSLTFITIPEKNVQQCRSMDKLSFAQ